MWILSVLSSICSLRGIRCGHLRWHPLRPQRIRLHDVPVARICPDHRPRSPKRPVHRMPVNYRTSDINSVAPIPSRKGTGCLIGSASMFAPTETADLRQGWGDLSRGQPRLASVSPANTLTPRKGGVRSGSRQVNAGQ